MSVDSRLLVGLGLDIENLVVRHHCSTRQGPMGSMVVFDHSDHSSEGKNRSLRQDSRVCIHLQSDMKMEKSSVSQCHIPKSTRLT